MGVPFECRAGPLLRTCTEGERQHMERRTSRVWRLEFGGRALSEGVGWGLGSVGQDGDSEGRGLGPGAQQASQCLTGHGRHWPCYLPFLHAPPRRSLAGSPPPYPHWATGPLTMGGSHWV